MMLQLANSMNMETVKMEIMHRKQQLIEFGQVILRESERKAIKLAMSLHVL